MEVAAVLDLGDLAARVIVDDRAVPGQLNAVHRRFGLFGSRLQADAGAAGSAAGSRLGGGFHREASAGVSRLSLAPAMAGFARFGAAGAAALGAVGAAGVGMGIQVAAGNENAQIAFETMLGSGEKARAFLDRLKSFAASTPFEFPELQTAASSLISAGVEADKVIPIMTSLGNATSGMGTGSEGVKRATVALQQMNAAGRITAEDLNQLRDAGIPVYDLLATATGKSKKEVAALAQTGKLGKKELDQMMAALGSGKGLERFNGLMEKQSASLNGMWSTVKDTLGQGLATAIQPVIPLLKEGLGGAATVAGKVLARLPGIITPMVAAIQRFRDSDAWAGIKETARDVFGAIRRGVGRLPELFDQVASHDWTPLTSALKDLRDAFSGMGPAVSEMSGSLPGLTPIISQAADVMKFLADHADLVATALPYLIAGFAAYKAAQAANNVVGRDSLIGFGLQLASTVALTVANFQLAKSQRSVESSTAKATGAENVSMLTRARATAATIASSVASRVAAAASKAWAATQWLLNAAMTANPIGIVVVAVAAFVAAIIIAYKHSATFRRIVKQVFDWVKENIPAALQAARDGVVRAWRSITGAFSSAWTWVSRTFRRAWSGVKGVVVNVVEDARDRVRDVWTSIRSRFSAAWTWVSGTFRRAWGGVKRLLSDPIGAGRDAIRTIFTNLRRRFSDTVDALGSIWDRLKAKMRTPISAVIGIINTGLLGAYNWVIDKLHLPASLRADPIKIKGYKAGGRTAAGISDDIPAGFTHANEHVWTANEVRQAGGHGTVERLRSAARTGALRLLGYATGGRVWPTNTRRLSGNYGGHSGVDIAAREGAPIYAPEGGRIVYTGTGRGFGQAIFEQFRSGLEAVFGHTSRIRVRNGSAVVAGQQIGDVGHTGHATGPHLHFEINTPGPFGTTANRGRSLDYLMGAKVDPSPGMAAAGVAGVLAKAGWLGAFANPAAFLRDRATRAMNKAGLGDLGTAGWGAAVSKIPGRLLPAVLDKIRAVPESAWHTLSDLAGSGVDALKGAVGRGMSAARRAGARLGANPITAHRDPSGYPSYDMMSSGATNRRIFDHLVANHGAYGIRYVIGQMRIASERGNWRPRPYHPITNQGDFRHTGHVHSSYYLNGTPQAARGFGWTGEKGAELVVNPQLRQFSGGERVLDSRQTAAALSGRGGSDRPYIGSLTLVSSGNVHRDLEEVGFKIRTITRGGVHA
jgi:tape measure domain-containing protein